MTNVLAGLAALIRERSGLRLERHQEPALRAGLTRAWPGLSAEEILERALDPVESHAIVATLINEVTIKETSFLRDRRQLESIDWQALYGAARAAGSSEIRVWSAACATGEEPYSLALLACEAFASMAPPIRILATDISTTALHTAAAGRYRARAVQGVEEPLRSRYVLSEDDHYLVIPALRSLVELAPHNLVAGSFPPQGQAPFDLILCRNVLIYFDSETSTKVVAGLERSLRDAGRLVLGAADALCVSGCLGSGVRRDPSQRRARVGTPTAATRRPAAPPRREPSPQTRTAGTTNEDRMNPDVHYLHGVAELESGNATSAIECLRRVLYLDPSYSLAAFALGRAHEFTGELDAARRRYEQALRMLAAETGDAERIGGSIDPATIADACQARLSVLPGISAATEAAR